MFSVIFDMDGTLLDTQKVVISAWDYAGENQGIVGVGNEIPNVCGMNKIGWSNYLRNKFPKLDINSFIIDAGQYISENLVVKFMPGAEKLLKFLKKNNVKIALASGSSLNSVMHHLNEVSAVEYFDAIVGGNEVINGKPAPDIFLLAAERLGVKPCECYVFEDSSNGIKAAYNAGMKPIGVPDIAKLDSETKKILFAEIGQLDEAIAVFEKMI